VQKKADWIKFQTISFEKKYINVTEITGMGAVLGNCINVATFVCSMAVFVTHTAHQVAVAAISPHVSHVQAVGLVVADVAHSPWHGEFFDVNE
jgi:hypothetical protein